MKIYFLTYGDRNFYLSKKNLCYLAESSGLFDNVLSLGPRDLDEEFKKTYSDILKLKKGGGYWIWKHRIIYNLLLEINDEDLIIYCDAGASFNTQPKAIKKFNEYIEILIDKNVSQLKMECEDGFIEKNYTNSKLFDYFKINRNSKIGNTNQLQAGHQFYKKNNETLDYFENYKQVLVSDPKLITDFYSNNTKQISSFIEHRHDQSIFSLLSKLYDAKIIKNETEFRNRIAEQYNYPFLSVRNYGHGKKDYAKYLLNRKNFLSQTVYFKN